MGPPANCNNPRAFTMVEVLVVVGIVLFLGALVLPAAGRVQALRDNTVCASNLRQVGLGILNYAHDHNGLLPGPLLSGQFAYWPHYSQLSWQRRDRPAGPRLKRFPRTSGCRGPLSPAQYGGFSPGRQTKPSSPVAGAGV